jgi:DNA topoisomerase IA
MRTDSVTHSQSAIESARSSAKSLYGADYIPATPRVYEGKSKNAQEAQSGTPIIIENASIDPRISSTAFKKQGIRSFASIPLQSRTRLIGAMNIGSFGQRLI